MSSTQLERERLLEAMLEEMVEKGCQEAEVEAALRRADLDGEWLGAFPDRDACLFAAYELLTERLVRATVERCPTGEDWPRRVCCGLESLLEELARAPAMAQLLTWAFPSIGPKARASYQAFVESFAPLLQGGRVFSRMGPDLPNEVEMLAVGAAEAIVFEEIQAGRAAHLPAMGPAILFSVLVPFLGPEAASAEMRKASEAVSSKGDLEVA